MALGPWQIAIILVIGVLVFGGRGKISAIMGDFGKGITSFRKGLKAVSYTHLTLPTIYSV